jgi:hypothetical protein
MEVYFANKVTVPNGLASHKIGNNLVVFKNGITKTTDKHLIVDILGSEIYRRGEVKLISDLSHVDQYLSGEDPETFTMDILNTVSDEGIRELAQSYQTKERVRTMLIKAELKGREVTDAAMSILETYPKSNTPKKMTGNDKLEFIEGAVSAGKLTKAGPWYKVIDGDFKSRNIDEVYDYLTKE